MAPGKMIGSSPKIRRLARLRAGWLWRTKVWVLLILIFGNIFGDKDKLLPNRRDHSQVQRRGHPPADCAAYVLGVITTFANAWHADRTGQRSYHVSLALCLAMVTFIVAAATTNTAVRYVSMILMIPGLYSGFTTALAWISSTLPHWPLSTPSPAAPPYILVTCTPSLQSLDTPAPSSTIVCRSGCRGGVCAEAGVGEV
ncbi:Pantothenate transporter liz1 [Tolypocladium paradoxum]|uniref:Pantothenate transporter liz1 n=1 Tax=Tolypocladium paradoxum TaxID=94208 RepID=A0A2S4KWV8_9HYPO|nr:Pantothenate transporter liz1 [Tolypocladium paradoxum]